MNVANESTGTYSGWSFNSFAYWNGVYLGATSSGIYALGGDYDDTATISATIEQGPIDFGKTRQTYLRDVWMTYRTDGYMRFTFSVDEDTSTEVTRDTQITSDRMEEEKIKVPRGLLGRYFTIKLQNLSGADFDIDAMSMMVDVTEPKR